jgi:hypothetical protein
MSSDFCSKGYTWTIQPNTCGKNVPPAALQSAAVVIEPLNPNLGFGFNMSVF